MTRAALLAVPADNPMIDDSDSDLALAPRADLVLRDEVGASIEVAQITADVDPITGTRAGDVIYRGGEGTFLPVSGTIPALTSTRMQVIDLNGDGLGAPVRRSASRRIVRGQP